MITISPLCLLTTEYLGNILLLFSLSSYVDSHCTTGGYKECHNSTNKITSKTRLCLAASNSFYFGPDLDPDPDLEFELI